MKIYEVLNGHKFLGENNERDKHLFTDENIARIFTDEKIDETVEIVADWERRVGHIHNEAEYAFKTNLDTQFASGGAVLEHWMFHESKQNFAAVKLSVFDVDVVKVNADDCSLCENDFPGYDGE